MNEDVNTYVTEGMKGRLMFTTTARDADSTPYTGNGWRNDRGIPRNRNIYEVHVHRDARTLLRYRKTDGSNQSTTTSSCAMG
jgi:hypothetical protein